MSKKTNVMSLSLEPEIQQQLKSFAKQMTKGNVSKAVRDLVEKHAVVDEEDDDELCVNVGTETHQQLKSYADHKTKGNVPEAMRELVEKYAIVEDDVIPIMLKVPSRLKGDSDGLNAWLGVRSAAIIKVLGA